MHDSLGLPESPVQTASRSVQPFCRAHQCDQQTNRHTDKQTDQRYSVCNNRPHLTVAAMRPNNNNESDDDDDDDQNNYSNIFL